MTKGNSAEEMQDANTVIALIGDRETRKPARFAKIPTPKFSEGGRLTSPTSSSWGYTQCMGRNSHVHIGGNNLGACHCHCASWQRQRRIIIFRRRKRFKPRGRYGTNRSRRHAVRIGAGFTNTKRSGAANRYPAWYTKGSHRGKDRGDALRNIPWRPTTRNARVPLRHLSTFRNTRKHPDPPAAGCPESGGAPYDDMVPQASMAAPSVRTIKSIESNTQVSM